MRKNKRDYLSQLVQRLTYGECVIGPEPNVVIDFDPDTGLACGGTTHQTTAEHFNVRERMQIRVGVNFSEAERRLIALALALRNEGRLSDRWRQ